MTHAHQTKGKASDIDILIGQRLKSRRLFLGISQSFLAEKLGITFQQIQKYERGFNRISAGRLLEASIALDAPISYFFDGIPLDGNDTVKPSLVDPVLEDKSIVKLINTYTSIKDKKVKESLVSLLVTLANNEDD